MTERNSVAPGPSYESKNDPEDLGELCQMWLDALDQAEEREWLKEAEDAVEVYRGKNKGGRSFNILHSNVETIGPAVYNSTPSPDVRRRYADADPVGKVVADIIERALEFAVDNYDFDTLAKSFVRDGELVGRGIPRVKYVPVFGEPITDPMTGEPVLDERGQPIRQLMYELVQCDYVPWRYFRRGPGRQWKDVKWVAFGEFLAKDDVREISPDLAEEIDYNYSAEHHGKGNRGKVGTEEESIFKRALVWQIWDKEARKVITIAQDYSDAPLQIVEDPLGLDGFYPIPRPYQPITAPDSLVPVVPYSIYSDQVEELNEITRRITKLIKSLRPRALYGGQDELDIKAWSTADDGQLVPATNAQVFDGGMEKALAWFPMEPTVNALNALVQQREQIKQTIYEVSGLGDILRGSTNPNETATAQQIKQKWGSLRINDRQGEVARVIRELFRLKAEVIAGKFSWETIVAMTGINPLPAAEKEMIGQQQAMAAQQAQAMAQQAQMQAQQGGQPSAPPPPPPQLPPEVAKQMDMPSREEVEEVLRSDILRLYRVDVESDSTIRGDMSRNQEQMGTFLEGTGLFAKAMGPIVQMSPEAMPVVLEIYSAFARHFKLGKQAEDAIDNLGETAQKNPPQRPQDPAAGEKAKIEGQMKAKQAEIQMQGEAKKAELAMQVEAEEAKAQQQAGVKQQELDFKRQEMEFGLAAERERLQMEREKHQLKIAEMREQASIRREDQQFAFAERERSGRIALAEKGLVARKGEGDAEEYVSGDDVRTENTNAVLGQVGQALAALSQSMAQQSDMQTQTLAQLAQSMSSLAQAQMAPTEIVRDPVTKKAVGARKQLPQRMN